MRLTFVSESNRNDTKVLVGIGRGEFIVGEGLSIKNPNIILNSSGFQQEYSSLLAPVLLRNPSSLKI